MNNPVIFIVDDEKVFLLSLKKHIMCLGYDVVTATSGQEALALLRAQPADLVITDLIMPEMSGVELMLSAKELYPALPFTKTEVFELPFMVKRSESGSQAIQKNSQDELKGVKLIFTHFHDGNQIHFGSKSVKSLEDIKGAKIRASGRIAAKTLEALGAVPVQMPAPAVPESISKSVIDGALIAWEVSTSLKLQEICKTTTETAPHQAKISNSIMVFAMNPAKYNSLSPELKKVIDNNSGRETSRWVGKLHDSFTAPARKIAVDRKNTINVLSDAEYKRWIKATEKVDDGWIKEVEAKGGTSKGKALLDDARTLLKKYRD